MHPAQFVGQFTINSNTRSLLWENKIYSSEAINNTTNPSEIHLSDEIQQKQYIWIMSTVVL